MANNSLVAKAAREMTLPNAREIERLYVEEELSSYAIAKMVGMDQHAVIRLLRRRYVKIRKGASRNGGFARSSAQCHDCGLRLADLSVTHEIDGHHVCDMCWHRRQGKPWEEDVNFFKGGTNG